MMSSKKKKIKDVSKNKDKHKKNSENKNAKKSQSSSASKQPNCDNDESNVNNPATLQNNTDRQRDSSYSMTEMNKLEEARSCSSASLEVGNINSRKDSADSTVISNTPREPPYDSTGIWMNIPNQTIDCTSKSTDDNESISLSIDKPLASDCDKVEDLSAPDSSDKKSLALISDPKVETITVISEMSNKLSNENVRSLLKECGYAKHVLYFSIIKDHTNGIVADDINTILSSYNKLNIKRLDNADMFNLLEENSAEILSLKKRLKLIIKERTKSYLLCRKCHKNSVSVLFLPCGHISFCDQCFNKSDIDCECCGFKIDEFHHVYF